MVNGNGRNLELNSIGGRKQSEQEKKLSSVGVMFVGLELYICSQNTFRAIWDNSGGWRKHNSTTISNEKGSDKRHRNKILKN